MPGAIESGEGLAPRPLIPPDVRSRSRQFTSWTLESQVYAHQRDQPDHVTGPCVPARPASVHARFPSAVCIETQRAQSRFVRARAFQLPPGDHAQAILLPSVQLFERRAALRVRAVVHPALQHRVQRLDGLGRRSASPLQT